MQELSRAAGWSLQSHLCCILRQRGVVRMGGTHASRLDHPRRRMISSRLASAWRATRDCSSRASCLWIRQPCTRSKKQIAEVFTARGAPSAHPLLPQRPAPAPRSCQRSQVPRRDQQRRRLPPPLPCPIRLGISACLSPRGRCGAPRCRESPRLPGKAGPVCNFRVSREGVQLTCSGVRAVAQRVPSLAPPALLPTFLSLP